MVKYGRWTLRYQRIIKLLKNKKMGAKKLDSDPQHPFFPS